MVQVVDGSVSPRAMEKIADDTMVKKVIVRYDYDRKVSSDRSLDIARDYL